MSLPNSFIRNSFSSSPVKSQSYVEFFAHLNLGDRAAQPYFSMLGLFLLLSLSFTSLISCSYSSGGLDNVSAPEVARDRSSMPDKSSSHDLRPVDLTKSTASSASPMADSLKRVDAVRPSLVAINSLGLAPVKISSAEASRKVSTADLGNISEEAINAFRANTSTEIVSLSEIKGASKSVLGGDKNSLLAFAKNNNIDGLLLVELQSFSSRSGSSFGTNQGAVFGVLLKVIDVASGKEAWEGSYYEQDSAGYLVDIRGGQVKKLQFRSVEDLMQEGFRKLASEFSESRLKAYTAK